MKELLFIMAAALPAEKIIEQLQDSINEWKQDQNDDNFKKVGIASSLVMAKMQVDENGGDMEGVSKVLNEIDQLDSAKKLISPPEN